MVPSGDLDPLISERRERRAAALGAECVRLRELIGRVGSGERTSRGLERGEAAEAIELLLEGPLDGAQAGAFLIAHRIRRPRPRELAGMLDAYRRHGPTLGPGRRRRLSFGVPYDGRLRGAPVLPLTACLLAAAGLGVVLHGGDPMPVKYGLTTGECLAALDLDLRDLSWTQVGALLEAAGLALLHQPRHFPAAERLVPIRERIGKRPPLATLELLWSCCPDPALQVSGYVHAPTEALALATWELAGRGELLLVKGGEGSADLPTGRVAVAAHLREGRLERLLLHARDHGLAAPEVELTTLGAWREMALLALRGEGPLAAALQWNGGFQLWRSGTSASLGEGIGQAGALLRGGSVEAWRRDLAARLGQATTSNGLTGRCFAFEADFVADLRCIPMAVRRKLDLAGVKLKLVHWGALAPPEKERLLAWGDDADAIARLRAWLLERSATLPQGPARSIEPATAEPWQQVVAPPAELLASCAQLGLALRSEGWSALGELERFALVKLSHPGHEHRNLPRALAEFGLLA